MEIRADIVPAYLTFVQAFPKYMPELKDSMTQGLAETVSAGGTKSRVSTCIPITCHEFMMARAKMRLAPLA